VEQILPYFQPAYNLTVDLVESIQEKRDIPIVLENITMQDDYEGNLTTRRVLIYTLRFTAKTYLFGPISTASKDVVKKVTVSYLTGDSSDNTSREVVYSTEPRAIKNYTGIVLTTLSKDITTTDTLLTVDDASSITTNSYLDIEGEEVYVRLKSGNILTVDRGAAEVVTISLQSLVFIEFAQVAPLIEVSSGTESRCTWLYDLSSSGSHSPIISSHCSHL